MDSSYLDIVVFAVIAVVLIWKLRSVLGQRTGNEKEPRDILSRQNRPTSESPADRNGGADGAPSDNVIRLPNRNMPPPSAQPEAEVTPEVARVRAVDPSFDADDFLEGAKIAFDMIIGAFGHGDIKALRSLLTPTVLETFSKAIESRQSAGETLESQLISIREAAIDDTRVEGTDVFVTVRFVSEQVSCLRDKDGTVVDGDEAHVLTLTDLWTFTRNSRARNPNWYLSETRTVDE